MRPEPVLQQDDIEVWDTWMRAAAVHAGTRAHARRVDSARGVVERALQVSKNTSVSWSGGKDSTALAHLVVVTCGAKSVELMSEKDDLDFPGEDAYVRDLAATWGARLRIVRPDVSPLQWIREHAHEMHAGDEIHARSAGLSRACFYRVVGTADRAYDVVMLGLRAEESGQRRHLRKARGRLYALRGRNGQTRALPIADWQGIDVYAYLQAHDVPLLDVYRCVGLLHRDDPSRLRKSWWLPGAGTARGQVAWLRRYYPSLYLQFRTLFPDASMYC